MNRTGSLMISAAALLSTSLTPAVPGVTLQTAQAVAGPGAAATQGVVTDQFFHVEWAASAGRRGRSRIDGYVYNDWGEFANSVQLRITELDAAGNVVSSVVQPVIDVPPGDRVYFNVRMPRRGQSYRVAVESYDFTERGK